MKIPCTERLSFIVSGLAFLQPALTNSQFYNLTLIATALVLGSKFCLSEINRMWLEEKCVSTKPPKQRVAPMIPATFKHYKRKPIVRRELSSARLIHVAKIVMNSDTQGVLQFTVSKVSYPDAEPVWSTRDNHSTLVPITGRD